jgi:ABC-type nitrate/sulfonate/bicarbonate transport system ATPase subunit
VIKCEQVWFKYKNEDTYTIRDASCDIASDYITAVVGKSGVGKSTFIAVVAGIYTGADPAVGDLSGRIVVDGSTSSQFRGPRVISWVPQAAKLLDHLTVVENVLLPMKITGTAPDTRNRCMELLESLGVADSAEERPRELSVGMQSRVALARALPGVPAKRHLRGPHQRPQAIELVIRQGVHGVDQHGDGPGAVGFHRCTQDWQ